MSEKMSLKHALAMISKQAPCPHDSINTNRLGLPQAIVNAVENDDYTREMSGHKVVTVADTSLNHGNTPELIMTCTIEHEVAFKPADVVEILKACHSDSMAKMINIIGKAFSADEFSEVYAADDLDEHGKGFIEAMHYFLNPVDHAAALADALRKAQADIKSADYVNALKIIGAAIAAYDNQEGK